jgi:type IV pilus assembly protein PilN
MIQINLLGLPKPKKGKRATATSLPGEGPNPMVVVMVSLLIGGVALGLWWMQLGREKARIDRDMAAAQREATSLAEAKQKYDEREAQRKTFEQRVKVIEDLRAKQAGPIDLLTMIGDTVNNTDGVWLATMKDDGRNVNLEGTALSVQQVANLMKNLQNTGYFRTVELKETLQDDQVKDMQQFTFTLTCEKADKTQPPQSATPAPSTGPKKL